MIKLRLKKYGRKGLPCYRIVAMESRTKRDGAAIEELSKSLFPLLALKTRALANNLCI